MTRIMLHEKYDRILTLASRWLGPPAGRQVVSFGLLVPCLGFLVGCGGHDMGDMSGTHGMHMLPDVLEVAPSEGRFETEAAEDLDPDPDVVELSLEATVAEVELAPGRTISMWTYNGLLPGPRIEARVGDTVRVHFKNSLPESTTIHWHGVRVPADMDGALVAQAPVKPDAEFTYEFVVPDAGTFWYHPHVRSDEQVERGLYGAIVVRAESEPETTTDRTLVLDDLLVDEDDWTLSAFDSMHVMVGRQGNLILVNGRAHPIVPVEPKGLHRFRFINAANARYFRLALPGHELIQIGTDGGLLAEPVKRDELLLVPGERADVLVVAKGDADEALDWRTLSYDRGHDTGKLPDAVLFQMKNTDDEPISTPELPTTFETIPALPSATVRRELELEESMDAGAHGGHGAGGMRTAVFSINGQVYPDAEPFTAKLGDVEEWSVVNTTEMDHPFHLHGFRFQVVSEGGRTPAFRAWRDTINIPAKETVKFRVRLENHPGTWMFHCHILEHGERGMMGELEVVEP